MTYPIIIILILLIGVLSYYSSARFGYRSSNIGPLPPHYAHLRRRLKQEKRQQKASNENFLEESEWFGNQ